VKLENQLKAIQSAVHGTIRNNIHGRLVTSSHAPSGQLNTANIAQLWPYASMAMGTEVFGDTDTPTVIHAQDGAKHSILASAVVKMPDLNFSAEDSAVGSVDITGVLATGKVPTDADAFYKIEGSSTFADSGFTSASIKSQLYTGALAGITGLTAVYAMDGFKVQFQTSIDLKWTPNKGFVGGTLKDVGVMVSFRPYGPTSAELLAAAGFQTAIGSDVADEAVAFTITGADTTTIFTLPKATLVSAGYVFGVNEWREGEVGLVASRGFTTGAMDALWTFVV
jgi:hypothetical protein